jgi:hypothetical protein
MTVEFRRMLGLPAGVTRLDDKPAILSRIPEALRDWIVGVRLRHTVGEKGSVDEFGVGHVSH